jgi:hypothetical protein
MKYFIIKIEFSKIIQVKNRRLFLLLFILSITSLFLMYFDPFDISSQSSISIKIYQQHIKYFGFDRTDIEPIIFSKSEYFNQTRKVKLFSLSHCFFFYTIVLLL